MRVRRAAECEPNPLHAALRKKKRVDRTDSASRRHTSQCDREPLCIIGYADVRCLEPSRGRASAVLGASERRWAFFSAQNLWVSIYLNFGDGRLVTEIDRCESIEKYRHNQEKRRGDRVVRIGFGPHLVPSSIPFTNLQRNVTSSHVQLHR